MNELPSRKMYIKNPDGSYTELATLFITGVTLRKDWETEINYEFTMSMFANEIMSKIIEEHESNLEMINEETPETGKSWADEARFAYLCKQLQEGLCKHFPKPIVLNLVVSSDIGKLIEKLKKELGTEESK